MKSLVKYIIKNIWENKFRTMLIVLTIVVCSALFFVSSTITDTTIHLFEKNERTFSGNSDIIITNGADQIYGFPDSFFQHLDIPSEEIPSMEYSIGLIDGRGFYNPSSEENVILMLLGIEWDGIERMNPIQFREKGNNHFDKKNIIISNKMAEKYSLTVSSEIPLFIEGVEYEFTVGGISEDVGSLLLIL